MLTEIQKKILAELVKDLPPTEDRPVGKIMHLPKYCVCRSEGFRYPFNMQDMVAAGIITEAQRDKYMEMLNSYDLEMEVLAVKILRKLKGYE